jgi:glucose dehydrogenase
VIPCIDYKLGRNLREYVVSKEVKQVKKILYLAMVILAFSAVAVGQNWAMVNYDNSMSRHSLQTEIGKNNVNQLQVKWILNTGSIIEASPLIVGKTGYVQNNKHMVIAFDMDTGQNKWKYDPNTKMPPDTRHNLR